MTDPEITALAERLENDHAPYWDRKSTAALGVETAEGYLGRSRQSRRAATALRAWAVEREVMRGALEDAEATLALCEHPAHEDPIHGPEVERLGLRIGFGALMTSAQASWRKAADVKGGEFVAGPCFKIVQMTLATIRQTLAALTPKEPEHGN